MLLGANWRPANAKSSMFHENNPNAACIDEMDETDKIQRMERKKSSVQATSHQLRTKLLCECSYNTRYVPGTFL